MFLCIPSDTVYTERTYKYPHGKVHGPEEVASSSGEKTLEPPSSGDVVLSLTGYQMADGKIQRGCNTARYPETVGDTDSGSNGSMSPDLGDLPEWEGELELDFTQEDESLGRDQ